MDPPSELPPVMLWIREKRLKDFLANPDYDHQHANLGTVLRMFQSGEIAPLWAGHQLYFCNGELLGSELPSDTRSLTGPVWHEAECGLAHEAAAYEQARLANVAPQIWAGNCQGQRGKNSGSNSRGSGSQHGQGRGTGNRNYKNWGRHTGGAA